jgi:hypothetical protein
MSDATRRLYAAFAPQSGCKLEASHKEGYEKAGVMRIGGRFASTRFELTLAGRGGSPCPFFDFSEGNACALSQGFAMASSGAQIPSFH